MARLIVYLDRDPTGLTPHHRASAVIEGQPIDGGWWRTEATAVAKLLARIAPDLVAACVVQVPRYTDDLDPRLAFVVEPTADDLPLGAIVTRDPIARTCVRCGHHECPCCADWCDQCLSHDDDTGWIRDGDWSVSVEDPTQRVHEGCATHLACTYADEPADRQAARNATSAALFDQHRQQWPHGGSFGVTTDGRMWVGPSHFDTAGWHRLSTDAQAVKRATALVANHDAGKTQSAFLRVDVEILRGLLRLAGAIGSTTGALNESDPPPVSPSDAAPVVPERVQE